MELIHVNMIYTYHTEKEEQAHKKEMKEKGFIMKNAWYDNDMNNVIEWELAQ